MDAAPAIEADDTVAAGQQDEGGAGSRSSEKKHPLSPAGNWYIADDR